MSATKRVFDIALALAGMVIFALPFLVICLWILLQSGRPIFYPAERMRSPQQPFTLWKFRSMRVVSQDSGVSGGDKSDRITPVGHILRRYRLDELPQLWNILRGDMSFVGPRPPLRQYVERFPTVYAQVLRARPGLTGLATLRYHRHEARLLARCHSAAETDRVYSQICVPRKAALDVIYLNNASVCFDIVLLWHTIAGVLWRKGHADAPIKHG